METRRRIVMRLFQTMTRDLPIDAVTVNVRIEQEFLDTLLGFGHFFKELNLVDPMFDQCVGSVSLMTAIDCVHTSRKRPHGSVSKSVIGQSTIVECVKRPSTGNSVQPTSLATPKATYNVCIIW